MSKTLCYFKGEYLEENEIYIHPLSPSTQYGLNVFEGIRGYFDPKDRCFYVLELEKHLNRLFESANKLQLKHKYSIQQIEIIIQKLLKLNQFDEDVYFKTVLLISQKGSWSQILEADLLIVPWKLNRAFDKSKKCLNLSISSWERISSNSMPPSVKTGANYINGRYAFLEAKSKNADLPLFLNNKGNVSESSGSCIVFIKDKTLYTPPLSADILDSITRQFVFEFSKNMLKYNTIIKNLTLEDIRKSDEAFLCGTSIEIFPVGTIDDISFSYGEKTITNKIKNFYFKLVRNETPYTSKFLKKIML